MKKVQWINGNHMKFDSLHKTFNRKIQAISTGNVIDDGFYSSFIRAFNETECNGFTNKKGHLQDFDLKSFRGYLPYYVIDQVKELTKDKSNILYVFRHWNGERKIVHGTVLTTGDYKKYKLIRAWYLNRSYKS